MLRCMWHRTLADEIMFARHVCVFRMLRACSQLPNHANATPFGSLGNGWQCLRNMHEILALQNSHSSAFRGHAFGLIEILFRILMRLCLYIYMYWPKGITNVNDDLFLIKLANGTLYRIFCALLWNSRKDFCVAFIISFFS